MVPAFSAVVVTHNSAAQLRGLLDSLERHLEDRPETIVVDAASADDSLEVARGRAHAVGLDHNPC